MTVNIRWTAEERRLLIENGHRIRVADPTLSIMDCLDTAQNVLAHNRRRNVRHQSITHFRWFIDGLNRICGEHAEIDVSKIRSKIFWTDEECKLLIEHGFKAKTENPERGYIECLDIAQNALDPERRRRILTLSVVKWFKPGIKQIVADNQARQLAEKNIELKPDVQPVNLTSTSDRIDGLNKTDVNLSGINLSNANLRDLVHAVVERVLDIVLDAWQDTSASAAKGRETGYEQQHATDQVVAHVNRDKHNNGCAQQRPTRRSKILVVGAKGDQKNQFFGIDANIQHMGSDDRGREVPNVDRCYVLADFCSHAMISKLQSVLGRDNVHIHKGGFSILTQKIRNDIAALRHSN